MQVTSGAWKSGRLRCERQTAEAHRCRKPPHGRPLLYYPMLRQHLRRPGSRNKPGRHHDVVAAALTLQPWGEIDGLAEVVEPLVERDGYARPLVQAQLEHDRC